MATRNLVPRATDEGGIGTPAKKWGEGHFKELFLDPVTVSGTNIAPITDDTAYCGTVSSRFKEMHSVKFIGTASEALYADLAEKFTTKQKIDQIPDGSVLCVSKNSIHDAEICEEELCESVLGAISAKPAYVMNNELVDGTPICVKGRVPVRIVGPIEKGNVIVAAGNGCARAVKEAAEKLDKIGYALKSDPNTEEKLVECFIV